MLLRPTVEADLDQVVSCVVDEPIGWIDEARYRAELAERQYRPEWTWIAEDGGRIVARAVWWAMADQSWPRALDCVHVDRSVTDRIGLAADLLAAGQRAFTVAGAPEPPEYHLTLPTGWRAEPAVAAALAWRREAARRAGLTDELERLQYEWRPGCPLPAGSGRLVFRPEPDDEAFVAVFRRVAEGSLDTHTARTRAALGAAAQARDDLAFYRSMPAERSWWRLAYAPDGRLVGFAIPSANPYGRNVGYLGVLPEHRGRGHIDEILGEITRFQAAAGADRITATTDLVNAPMAAAFDRAGYRNTSVRLVLSAPAH